MLELLETIQRIAIDTVRASDPIDLCFGEVAALTPFTILDGDKLRLSGKTLLFTETTARYQYKLGDVVIMLREQGGQRYLILDKAVTS